MYMIEGWYRGGKERMLVNTWDEVLMLFSWLEEDMYSNLLVRNLGTGQQAAGF